MLRRFSQVVEKISCDEGFFDVTKEVDYLYRTRSFDFKKPWKGYFMGFDKEHQEEAYFEPMTEIDRKLYIAAWIAKKMRDALYREL